MTDTLEEPGAEQMREALKRTAVALKQTGVPFTLTGGYAAWARGAPESVHDVDFLVAEEDAAGARESLVRQGFTLVDAPEDWLFKVAVDGVTVDVIFRVGGRPATRDLVRDSEEREVLSIAMPVQSATEVVAQKLGCLDEHYCDFARLIPVARALREQVDWERVRAETAGNPFAEALLFLLDRLDIV